MNDLRQRFRDRSAIIIAIIVPLALAGIFRAILGDSGSGNITFKYAVVAQDNGAAAKSLVATLDTLKQKGIIKLSHSSSVRSARDSVSNARVDAAFIIPPGFSDRVANEKSADLKIIGSVDSPIGTLVAHSIADSYTNGINSVRTAVAAAITAKAKSPPTRLASEVQTISAPIKLSDVSAKRKQLEPATFYAAGMAVFFLFFTVQYGVPSLLRERREGTLARLLAAPISPTTILLGKALTSVFLGIISMTVLVLATSALLGAHWGNPLGVALLIISGVIAATAVMTLVATFAQTVDQANYWQTIVALVLGMVGGCFFPVAQAGGLLNVVSLATPQAWFLRGLGNLTGGAGISAIATAFGAIMLFAVITGTLAIRRSGRLIKL
jgi:ABC-2 type transport system permease protein